MRSIAEEIGLLIAAGTPPTADVESFPARHPGRDCAVLACACGTVLDARDMVRITGSRAGFNHETSTVIYRIGCRACALEAIRPRKRR